MSYQHRPNRRHESRAGWRVVRPSTRTRPRAHLGDLVVAHRVAQLDTSACGSLTLEEPLQRGVDAALASQLHFDFVGLLHVDPADNIADCLPGDRGGVQIRSEGFAGLGVPVVGIVDGIDAGLSRFAEPGLLGRPKFLGVGRRTRLVCRIGFGSVRTDYRSVPYRPIGDRLERGDHRALFR